MAAKFGPDQVVLPSGSSDPTGTREVGEIFYNTSDGAFKQYNGSGWEAIYEPPLDGSTEARAAASPQDLYDMGLRANGTYWLNPDGNGAGLFYCLLDGTYGSYGWALSMRIGNPYWHPWYFTNHWDGHSGADGPDISDSTTYNGTYGHYLPDNADYMLFGFTNNNNNTLTQYVHTSVAGNPTTNTGWYARSLPGDYDIDVTLIQQNVTGMTTSGTPRFCFNRFPTGGYSSSSYYHHPVGYARGLSYSQDVEGTYNLLGSHYDSCETYTSPEGVTNPYNTSETYIGSIKGMDGSSGSGGTLCGGLGTSYGKWLAYWR